MAKKTFFAAFVIDEECYTPEPGPVDRHFVASDLAQSNFAEQPGVSNVVVWDSMELLISEHRQPGPTTVEHHRNGGHAEAGALALDPGIGPSSPWNCSDNIYADLDNRPVTTPKDVTSARSRRSFRDHLSPTMQSDLAFEYYEVRPCIERGRQITSFADEADYAAELVGAQNWGEEFRTFWALYGIDAGSHTAIGDFVSKDAAHQVMNAILAVPAASRNAINGARPVRCADATDIEIAAGYAADWLGDMINQSSNAQRI